MNKNNRSPFYLFLVVAATIAIALTGCSFKKAASTEKTVPTHQADKKTEKMTLREIILQDDEQVAIQELTHTKIENINSFGTKEGSLIDTAISKKKLAAIKLLTIKGHSPFNISRESYKSIESDSQLKELISELQLDEIHHILSFFPDSNVEEQYMDDYGYDRIDATYDKYLAAIKDARLGADGCSKFIDVLVALKYDNYNENYSLRNRSNAFYSVSPTRALTYAINSSECKQYFNIFPQKKINAWVIEEILSQYRFNFASTKFLKILLQLGDPKDLTIVVSNFSDDYGSFHYNVTPISLLMLKQDCISDETIDEWSNILRPLTSNKSSFYLLNYEIPPLSATDQINTQNCTSDVGYCLDENKNIEALTTLFGALFTREHAFREKYSSFLKDKRKSATEMNAELKSLVCGKRDFHNQDEYDDYKEQYHRDSKYE